ncbi:hypothetical protein MWX51_005577 [Pseudomonas aeruginosa]|nr:hypothetical protein [Pseudomonas aeruginosa]
MNGVQTLVGSLWWMPHVFVLAAAFCLYRMGANGYAAWFLWRHRNTPISDPVIAKAVEGVKPPRYWLYALAWAFGALELIHIAATISRELATA